MKLSFKREKKETGLAAVGNPNPQVQIKADKKRMGQINPPSRFGKDQNKWSVSIMVKKEPTKEEPADFRWLSFKFRGDNEQECRDFVTKNWEHFVSTYDFRYWED